MCFIGYSFLAKFKKLNPSTFGALMKKSLFLIAFVPLLCAAIQINAQPADSASDNKKTSIRPADQGPFVKVNMAESLQSYMALMDSLDAKSLKSFGYRIQTFSSSGPDARKQALLSQSEFLRLYADYPSYTLWQYPNWVVRLGNYRTYLQAMEFHNEIKAIYPASFIVRDEIQVKLE